MTRRWTMYKKAVVLHAIERGHMSKEDAVREYSISKEELESWSRLIKRFGIKGLRQTKIQEYRGRKIS